MKKDLPTFLSPKLSFKVFKKIYDAVPDSGPTPEHMDKVLWQMMRGQKIYIGIGHNDFFFTIERPQGKYQLITNP